MSARFLALAGTLALVLGLGGCGFHPLYADTSVKGGQQVFESIYVDPIEGEIAGYELRNSLIDALHSPPKSEQAPYRLAITISQTVQAIAIENNASITRYNYVLLANYTLTDKKGVSIKKGTVNTISAYDVVASPYATLVAEHDAQKRGARDVAYRIQVELAVYFSHRTRS